jgi:hypothetical protein
MAGASTLPKVTDVEVIGRYALRLTFDDGVVGDVRFDERHWYGVFESFNDPAVFAQVQVDEQFGTIVWPGGQDMAPEPLYEQALAHSRAPDAGILDFAGVRPSSVPERPGASRSVPLPRRPLPPIRCICGRFEPLVAGGRPGQYNGAYSVALWLGLCGC